MSSGEVRKVSRQDIQLVQNLIERCLQLYMNQKEVVDTLLYQAKIEPGFTELVWQKLEEENQEFFKAYHVRLLLKNQIIVFNKLLEKQVELMQICPPTPPGVASVPHANVQQTQPCYLSDHASSSPIPDNMFCNGMNGASSGNQSIQLGNDVSILAERTNMPSSLLSTHSSYAGRTNGSNGTSLLTTHNSHVGRSNGNNGTTEIKSEPSYSNNSDFSFGADDSFLDTRAPIGVEQSSSFTGSELNGQPLNDSILDIDNSYGFLSQIPRNFSFSDLADDFTRTADILENYGPGRSPFLESETDDFSDSPQRDCKEEDRRLDTISQDVSYDDFASD